MFFSIASASSFIKNIVTTIEEVVSEPLFFVEVIEPKNERVYSEGEGITITSEITPISGTANPFSNIVATDYIHFLAYGQSLSAGNEGVPLLSINNVLDNVSLQEEFVAFGDTITPDTLDTFYPLEFDGSTTEVYSGEPVEAPVVGWANAFKSGIARELPSSPLNNSKVVASSTGKGGQPIVNLLKGTAPYDTHFIKALNAGKRAAGKISKTITVPSICYMQGESEPNETTYEQYKTMMLQLFTDMRNDVMTIYGQATPPVILLYQPKEVSAAVTNVYADLIQEYNWIVGFGNVYPLPFVSVHLDPNGYRWMGEQIAKAMVLSIKENKKFQPLLIESTEVIDNTVVVTFNKNIVVDTVSRTGSNLGLRSITVTDRIVSGKTMTLVTVVSDLSSYGEIYLADIIKSNIRDNDTYQATTNLESFIEVSPTFNNIVDINGDVPFGQPYPMWNWLYEYFNYKVQ